ncbi:MAG: DUF6029 family protein [Ignavibacteria bacterium]|jgi:hypothetical protein|nr:DUF6029 family protein [Ignavibacteria bacterium]
MNKFNLIITITLISVCVEIKAQSDEIVLPQGLSISNQLDYAYYTDAKEPTLENWFNLDYTNGIFSTGFRLDIFQPNNPDPSINKGKFRYSDIAFKFVKLDLDYKELNSSITLGNFYGMFGRGMVFKSYEDRNVRVDNNLMGIKLSAEYKGFTITALSGMPEKFNGVRADILHAFDIEYKGLSKLPFGFSYASSLPDVPNSLVTSLSSIRIQPSIGNFDIYFEYGIKQNDEIKENIFNNERSIIGRGFYGNLSYYYSSFSILGEVKYYDNFALVNSDGTVFYNTPPSLRKEYTYVLLNRHPSPLDQANEKGFQFEANYNYSDNSFVTLNFGMTETLPKNSFHQLVNKLNLDVVTQQKEFFMQVNHKWNEGYTSIVSFGYNKELQTNTISYTPILENRFYFGGTNTIKVVVEHQQNQNQITGEEYYSDVLEIEYLKSPNWSLSLITEIESKEPTPDRIVRKVWSFIQFGYQINEQMNASILVGTRQAGNICIGGVCRYEPEFRGIEFSLMTRI